ncbi:hypothetical protein DAPPUDRAFT_233727 [Daphnia pulex]|uniref:Uncharacterized protein n=1 Tax=Daphnia pulex TaxID=6669 RepID=E9FVK0_DAPPU|nr:hypothetical protein DAPPUDRAFT_233727 [Daphnia pulex]|eukprot:EFX89092.1 hypothetical protein DAPPUDRAFT_233727 [Daphnia pulex]
MMLSNFPIMSAASLPRVVSSRNPSNFRILLCPILDTPAMCMRSAPSGGGGHYLRRNNNSIQPTPQSIAEVDVTPPTASLNDMTQRLRDTAKAT